MYKIGFLLGSLNGAGAEKTILTLSSMLASAGHEVDLYLLESKQDYKVPSDVNVIVINAKNDNGRRAALHELTKTKTYNLFVTSRAEFYDSVCCDNTYCSVHITPTARITPSTWKFWHTFKKTRKLKKKFRNKRLISLSQGIKNDLVENLGCLAQDIMVINNPFEVEKIQESAKQNDHLPSYPYIIHVGSFLEVKRHCDLLDAFANIDNKTVKLLLVGKGKLEESLKQLVNDLGLNDRVVFWGWDSNPYRLIKHAKLLVLSSESEGMPRVIVESLLLNTPVVSTDCRSGPNELLTGNLRPFLVPVGDPKALAKTIDLALISYPAISQEELQKFNANNVMNKYLELIQV